MITQNRGEWSEIYVFLKLLGDGVIYGADSQLNKIPEQFYPLIAILRESNNGINTYQKKESIISVLDNNKKVIVSLSCLEFEKRAQLLLSEIKTHKATFSVKEIEDFMNFIQCTQFKSSSRCKSDITVILRDTNININNTFDFSIKSKLGGHSTLLNAGKTTNLIYKIHGNIAQQQIDTINNISSRTKIKDRISKIYENNCFLEFHAMESDTFKYNLQMIDSSFPDTLGHYVLLFYRKQGNMIHNLTTLIEEINPCKLDTTMVHTYYKHKMKTFLTNSALGMTPARPWTGEYQVNGGYIIVKEDGDIVCYHIYNINELQSYIFQSTYLDTASSTRHDFGTIYQENNDYFFKLNLQIRFQ